MSGRKRWTHLDQMVRSGMAHTMTPIESAARALVSWELGLSDHATNQNRYGASLDERYAEVERRWPDKVEQARIVLAAIREPSDATVEAGSSKFRGIGTQTRPAVTEAWEAMIDAALAEGA